MQAGEFTLEIVYNNPTMASFLRQRLSRRQALEMLGLGAAAAAIPTSVFAQEPTFPRGAIIRTILKDYAPEELAGGATLFHEHMSFASNFMTRWTGYAAETRALNGPPPAAGGRGAGGAGGGRGAGAGAGAGRGAGAAEPSGPFFMTDAEFMAEEMRVAK